MFNRLAIRGIPEDVASALQTLADRHDRSLEAEARIAMRAWVEPSLQAGTQATRRRDVARRLNELLNQANDARRTKKIKPSHIAQAIEEGQAEPVERWFTGEEEPRFDQLRKVASLLGGNEDWLLHGDDEPFKSDYKRIAEGAGCGVAWLLDLDKQSSDKLRALHFIRSDNEDGSFCVVKEYNERRCRTYTTPYHISNSIGAGGEASLKALSLMWRLLYLCYTKSKIDINIKSYIMRDRDFVRLTGGNVQPFSLIDAVGSQPWWEDFWDASQFQSERANIYWPEWRSICERIHSAVEADKYAQEEVGLMKQEKHPTLLCLREKLASSSIESLASAP